MGRINLKAADEQIAAWKEAADGEQLSLSAWARRVLSASAELTGQRGSDAEGESVVRPGPSAEPVGDPAPEPEPHAVEAPAPPEFDEERLAAEHAGLTLERARQVRPDPKTKPAPPKARKALSDVMSGTVSGAQSVKAIEAQRTKAAREDAFSLVCPMREKHVVGARCPICHGIQ